MVLIYRLNLLISNHIPTNPMCVVVNLDPFDRAPERGTESEAVPAA